MKELESYKDDIYKCSRCGLCQSVCPVFKATLNECAVSRGKFNILNGIIKGDLSLTKNVKKYLDLCTGCNACTDFCPSQIDAKEIFVSAKFQFYKENKTSFADNVLNSYFTFKFLLNFSRVAFILYRAFFVYKLVDYATPLLLKFGLFGKRILLLNKLVMRNHKHPIYKKNLKKIKICVDNSFFQSYNDSVMKKYKRK